MAVAINMPTRRQTVTQKKDESMNPIDMLLKGLDIATRVSGIYTNIQQAKDMKVKQQANEIALSQLQRQELKDAQIAAGNIPEEDAYRLVTTGQATIGRPEVVVEPDEMGKPKRQVKVPEGATLMNMVSFDEQSGDYKNIGEVYFRPKYVETAMAQEEKQQKNFENMMAMLDKRLGNEEKTTNRKMELEYKKLDQQMNIASMKDATEKWKVTEKKLQDEAKRRAKEIEDKNKALAMPEDQKKVLNTLETNIVNQEKILNVLENDLVQFRLAGDDPGLRKTRGFGMAKGINSVSVGNPDAVGQHEADEMLWTLDYQWYPTPTKNQGYNYDTFDKFVTGKIDSVKKSLDKQREQAQAIRDAYAKPNAQPVAQFTAPNLSQVGGQQAPNPAMPVATGMTLPGNQWKQEHVDQYMQANEKLKAAKDPRVIKILQEQINMLQNFYGSKPPMQRSP